MSAPHSAIASASASTPGALPRVGFIGIGKMGLPMVEHLRKSGYDVIVHDTLPANALQVRLFGCDVAETLGGYVSQADVLFSSMPNDAALGTITSGHGNSGWFAQAKPGMIFVHTSTVSVAVSSQVAERMAGLKTQ